MLRCLIVAACVFSASAEAALIRLDVEFQVATQVSTWTGADPMPSAFTGSFVFDTATVDSADFVFGAHPSGAPDLALTQFRYSGIDVTAFDFWSGGTSLWSGSGASADHNGDLAGSNSYDSWMSFSTSDRGFSFLDTDLIGVYTQSEFLASADPLLDLLLKNSFSGPVQLRGEWGNLWSTPQSVSKSVVSEPATFGLMALGMLGVLVGSRRRSR